MTESGGFQAQVSGGAARPRHRHYEADMLSVEEALGRILSHFEILPAEEAAPVDALGQVLAEDLTAAAHIPPFPNSAMDGYALRSADVTHATQDQPARLVVIGAVAAGQMPGESVAPGRAVRIMTGAPVPEGADAVVPFEDTDEVDRQGQPAVGGEIGVQVAVDPGENVRPAGSDVQRGSVVLRRGAEVRAGVVGVIASLGQPRVRVFRRPVAGIVATGDELLALGEPPRPGAIYDSNSHSIAALVRRYGGIANDLGIARDTVKSLSASLDAALESSDFVITSAGVSKGDYDVVKDVLASRGEIALWSVRMRPAKPLAFGTLKASDGRAVPLLGLPGNPVSAMVAFEQFARPAIRLMMGKPQLPKPTVQAVLDDPITNHDGRRVYARVVAYRSPEGYRARTTGSQSSNVLTSMAVANGLAICPHDVPRLQAGETATVQMLDWPEEVF